MGGIFYQLGRLAGPKIRKAQWMWAATTASEADVIAAEHAVGQDMAQYVRQQRRVCADTKIVELLCTVGNALTSRLRNKLRTFEFTCLSGEQAEAFCLPGGFVFVSRAMIELCGENVDRLAFVLAHEMAHLVEGHVMERMVGNAVIQTAARAGMVRYAASGALGKLGMEFLEKAYSRRQELDADAFGLRLSCAAGFNGQAAIDVFELLARQEQSVGLAKYFSTHPECRERIAHLRRLLRERPK
jgi:predicted Zn-dependent protease